VCPLTLVNVPIYILVVLVGVTPHVSLKPYLFVLLLLSFWKSWMMAS
jgi:hypothetical protein